MNAKYNEEVISGWANQNQINQDTIRLTNILKRKSTVQALPQLKYMQNKIDTQHRKQITNIKAISKDIIHRKSHNILKIKRERTEGYDEQQEASPGFKNEKIFNAMRLEEVKVSLSPYLTDCQIDGRYQRMSDFTEFEARSNSNHLNNKKRQSQASTFSNTLQTKMTPIKSHQFIPQVNDKFQSPKKYDSKYYVKLSTLQIVNDLRKQFRNDFLLRFGAKPCISEQRDQRDERNTSKINRKEEDIYKRINQRFRQTFIKQDIFNKNKRKDKLLGKPDASDPIILSEHSIVLDKQSLQAKIQSFRSPHKGRLILK